MKKILALLVVVFATFGNLSAQDISPKVTSFLDYYGKDDVIGMEKTAGEIISIAPDNYAGYAFKAYASILKNDLVAAADFSIQARNLNPVDQGTYGIDSYVEFANGNTVEATKLMDYSFQLKGDETLLKVTMDDIVQIERITKKDLSALKEIAKKANAKATGSIQNMQQMFACQQSWSQGKPCNQEAAIKNYFNGLTPKNLTAAAILDYYKAIGYYNAQQWDDAKNAFNKFVANSAIANAADTGYPVAQSYYYLSLYENHNANALYINATKGLEALAKLKAPTLLHAQLLHRKSLGLGGMGKADEQLRVAEQLLADAKKISFPYMEAQANNTIGSYYVTSSRTDYRQKAFTHLSAAYNQAKQINDPALVNLISGNYAISLWQQGKKTDALNIVNGAYNHSVQNKEYSSAQLLVNNLGFMAFFENDYTNAARLFRQAVNITEQHRKNLDAAQQLAIMNEHTSAYGGLILSLQKLNDVNGLFEIQDLNRSRLLRDKLDKKATAKSMVATQKMLKPDEVLLYYSEAAPGEMIVSVITSTSASIGYNYPIEMWLRLKKEYLNQVMKKPNSINDYVAKMNEEVVDGKVFRYSDAKQGFKLEDYENAVNITSQLLQSYKPELKEIQSGVLKFWYDFLIKPIETKLAGKKTLIISGEGSLNYIPFESFMNSSDKYLIEDFDIRYIPSATVWGTIRERNYSDTRKPLLAMGGATYQDPGTNSGSVRGIEQLLEVQKTLTTKINSNKNNLSTELKAFGFAGAKYLAGSLREVQNLQKIIPEATVLTAGQMKESDLKNLNATGALSGYKWIHIATHGFALDNVPELSGVMMTQPPNGDGNEDMFLLTHEIANLTLKADLTIFSACDTALGKIYGGEGINGLSSALLTAGSNNTLLSMWPVSDQGTMVMMTVLYDKLFTQKQSVSDAVNSTKREMLKGAYGEQFSTPVIWAPFILSGR